LSPFETLFTEPVPSSSSSSSGDADGEVISSPQILDQLVLTNDDTDYLWTSASFRRASTGTAQLSFSISTDGGPVLYVFVNGELAASTVEDGSTAVRVQMARMKEEENGSEEGALNRPVERVEFEVPVLEGINHVDVLFASMGLKNYGPVSAVPVLASMHDVYVSLYVFA
jgi:hypothetical protein